MIKKNLQIILAVVTFASVMTVLPGHLHAEWKHCLSRNGGGCSPCSFPCYHPSCTKPIPASIPVSGTTYSTNDTLIKYDGTCCSAIPRTYNLHCGPVITSPDWNDMPGGADCGDIDYMCGDRWTAAVEIYGWFCSINLTADKTVLNVGDEAHLTATTKEDADYSPTWECLDEEGNVRQCDDETEDVSVTLTADGSTATASDPKGNGKIRIRVKDPYDENCIGEIQLDIDTECSITVTADKDTLLSGDTAKLTAATVNTSTDDLTWSLYMPLHPRAFAKLTSNGKTATISEPSGKGWVTVHAKDPDNSDCFGTVSLYIDACPISLLVDKNPLSPGETAVVTAATDVMTAGYLTWTLTPIDQGVNAKLTPSGRTMATVTEAEGEGWVRIRVEDSSNGLCYEEEELYISGCTSCENDNASSCDTVENGSIKASFSLGKAERGKTAGHIVLRTDTPDPANATPEILDVFKFGNDTKVLYDGTVLRQVVAPERFVDIAAIDDYKYNMLFYNPDDMGNEVNGFYEIVEGSVPFVTWVIENPDGAASHNRLRITRNPGTGRKVYEYTWDGTENIWTLDKGNGLQIIAKKKETVSGNRVETETVKDSSGAVASKKKTTYREITCDSVTREWITEEITDPDGDALTVTSVYYEEPSCSEGSCGLIQSRVDSDDSWVRYEYDAEGRKTAEVSSWLDAPQASDASSARAVYYDYSPQGASDSDAPQDVRRPRKITEKILGIIVAQKYYVYQVAESGERTEISEQCADQSCSYGDTGNRRTVIITHPYGEGLPESWQTESIVYPDSRTDSFSYEYGTYAAGSDTGSPGVFTPGAGDDIRTVIVHGTVDSPDGIADSTTREINIESRLAREYMNEVQVYTGTGYETVEWTVKLYDDSGHVTDVYSSDGTHSQSSWSCCNKDSETGAGGIIVNYTDYDDLGHLLTRVKQGIGNIPDITTAYTYDATGRRLTEISSSQGLSSGVSSLYDISGRITVSTDARGLDTAYDYNGGGKTTTVTYLGGATQITNRYADGRIRSITGTGTVHRFYTYGVDSSGDRWTTVCTGSESSPMYEKTVTDMLGRTKSVEKPGGAGTPVTTRYFYNDKGQLERVSQPGQADTLFEYDSLGNQTRTGIDVNGNEILDGNDRITENKTDFSKIGNVWWRETVQQVYAKDSDDTATDVSFQRTRLTGLGSDGLVNENISVDIHGNQTVAKTFVNRAAKSATQRVDYPDSSNDAVSVSVNGLPMSSLSKTGVETTYSYDALGRRTGTVDPRTGETVTHYNDKGQVDYVEDPKSSRIQYIYDAFTGRKKTYVNAMTKTTRYLYNDRGQTTHTWGDAAEPVKFVYDSYGRMTEMHMFRGGSGWDGEEWPSDTAGEADITRWHYDEASGLLQFKEYDDGKGVTYTYKDSGRIETRIWARKNGTEPLFTTYIYDPSTGDLTDIDYSDSTQDIGFTYDRPGRQKTVTDAAGTRTFSYSDSKLMLESETITGLYNRVITRTYDTANVQGRPTGFSIGADYSVAYGYEPDTGRFGSVSWNSGASADMVAYTYEPNSDLLHGLTIGNKFKTTYQYEPERNLRTQIKNEFESQTVSQYDYQYDGQGSRTSLETGGSAFSGGTAAPDVKPAAYTANSLNQYTDIVTTMNPGQYIPGQDIIPAEYITANPGYDDDGNLTGISDAPGTLKYSYNAENRLIAAAPELPAQGDKKVEFVYDYMGRRVKKTVSVWNSSWTQETEKLFVYDGWNMICEITTESGQSATEKYYIWGLDLSQSLQGAGGIGGLIAALDKQTGVVYYYLYDANGNVGQLVNAADGSIAAHYEYDPFGNLIKAEGEYKDSNPYRFSTKRFGSVTGLYYYGFRYYSTELGRWLSRDPLNERGGLNLYLFVRNNPINETDPFGLEILALLSPDDVMSMISADIVPPSVEDIQLFLELAGIYDPSGLADLTNALVYAINGKSYDSLLSLGSMFPYLGDIICKGGKMAKKAKKVKEFIKRIFSGFRKNASSIVKVPGRVQSRINLKTGSVSEGAGWLHVLNEHFNPAKNKSQFTISQSELRTLLQSKEFVGTPVTRTLQSSKGVRYVREVDVGKAVGNDMFNNFKPTSTMTVLTDEFGNLVTATPGVIY